MAVTYHDGIPDSHPHDGEEHFRHLYHGKAFYDGVHGKPLDKDMAIQARKFEMQFFKGMEVYTQVDRSVAKPLGAKVITTKWIDTNQGDDYNLGYRAGLV